MPACIASFRTRNSSASWIANAERAAKIAAEFSTKVFPDIESLAGQVDAASVAVPTVEHARVGCRLLELGIDVLVEKPMAASLAEADDLLSAASRRRTHPAGRAPGAIQSGDCGGDAGTEPSALF